MHSDINKITMIYVNANQHDLKIISVTTYNIIQYYHTTLCVFFADKKTKKLRVFPSFFYISWTFGEREKILSKSCQSYSNISNK